MSSAPLAPGDSLPRPTPPVAPPPRVGFDMRSGTTEEGAALERRARRRGASLVFVAAGALIAVAAYLTPAAEGMGTHLQLRMPPCGWIAGFGVPCPSCGMTTAFAAAADGDLIGSFRAQPLGCLLAIATAATAAVSAYVMATGSAIGGHFLRLVTPRFGWWLLGLVVAAWIYKVMVVRSA